MNKKIIALVIMCSLTFGLIGCNNTGDVVNEEENIPIGNRFIDTGDTYLIAGNTFSVWYDSNTNIVYMVKKRGGYGTSAITVMYDSDGQPMTIDKYNETK